MRTKPFEKFGRLLREARAARKWTQGQLAKRLKVGQQAISGWERGASRPETKALVGELGSIFQEHELVEWLHVTHYQKPAVTTVRAKSNKPVRPTLESLPLEQLNTFEL